MPILPSSIPATAIERATLAAEQAVRDRVGKAMHEYTDPSARPLSPTLGKLAGGGGSKALPPVPRHLRGFGDGSGGFGG